MNFAYSLDGGVPVIKKYRVSETFGTAGGYATVGTSGAAGVVLGVVTTVADQLGSNLDTATYSTTQGSAADPIAILINPLAVYRLRMCNSATSGTQLVTTTNITASAAGTVVTKTGASGVGDPDINSPTMDEGTIVCISGANVSQERKITSVAATTATVTDPFDNDIAVGDVFVTCPWTPGDTAADNIQLTTDLTEARHDIAVGTGADFRPIALEWDTADASSARRNSYVYAVMIANVFTVGT